MIEGGMLPLVTIIHECTVLFTSTSKIKGRIAQAKLILECKDMEISWV